MKKFLILSMAAAFVVALSMPARAWVGGGDVQFGARVNQEIGWQSKSKELTTNGEDDINRSYLRANSNSYFRAKFTSKDKSQGALIEMGVGSTGSGATSATTISTRHMYGWYKVGNCTLTVGHTDNWTGNTFWTAQKLQAETHGGDMLGWGKAWAGRRAQVQLKYAAGKTATLMFALARPRSDATPTGASIGSVDKYYQIPQLEFAVQLKGKNWAIIPSAVWYQAKFDKTPSSYDDNITSWGLILPAKVSFGAFTVMAEIHYGQNTNNVWYGYDDSKAFMKASGSVEDTKHVGGFLDLAYKVGKSTIHVGGGYESFTNDAWKSEAGYKDDNASRKLFYVSVPTKIGQNLWLYPEFDYYDYGESLNNKDQGNEWVLGLLFRFLF